MAPRHQSLSSESVFDVALSLLCASGLPAEVGSPWVKGRFYKLALGDMFGDDQQVFGVHPRLVENCCPDVDMIQDSSSSG